ncbi:LysM peptidoglycan-binding domain-containing M23 family metallopeptidase [Shimia aestuarii]|uniref:Murein DD-endopeptidase MepM and murein hydrolase activator NlpD, contain LysM domain n=1 Tax=Shimia aestuarii TaxID=254406 RepID=A0A1I4LJI9_9RHOB|nr:LysM peptidoglycan-binding domain-containing M23 family metallopeptidase [Shimia aestuarii]SFL91175.1 Murein DD-endopeptidase MepM and murein hydrolase activator NlpD, contain LysM domain [Shimia aestuarii]
MGIFPGKPARLAMAGLCLALVAACDDGFDVDLRGGLGAGLDTTTAAKTATAKRPRPDNRGIISYPGYQVAVAKRGDTLSDVSARVGIPASELAKYNGIQPDARLRDGEIVALPYKVAEPSAATGGTGIVQPPQSDVDIAAIAGNAIDKAEPEVATETLAPAAAPAPNTQTGYEPIRHKVKRGETAFTISRLYNVSVRSLAEWNGLGSDFTIRENQILLIPPADPVAEKKAKSTSSTSAAAPAAAAAAAATTLPGQGSPTPTPPSSTKPLPPDDTKTKVAAPQSPDLGKTQSASSARMSYPVDGKIIRPYSKGKNNGIDIAGKAGTPVKAAADGKVAAITTDADDVKIVVLRHSDNLMTVYYNVDTVKVSKGASVKRGEALAVLPAKDSFVHFEVRKGFDSVDPMPYLK